MTQTQSMDGQVVLVTGAAGALAGGVVAAFEDADATVAGVDIVDPAEVETGASRYLQADLTDEAAVEATVDAVVEEMGSLDALVNIAGTWRGGDPVAATPLETFDLLVDVNLKTMFLASKHAIPHLRDSGGAIVSISAKSALAGGAGDALYRATKAGVKILTESIAVEEDAVRANAILPKVIDTPMNREMMPDADHAAWPTPAAIAEVILFLCSDAAGVTSGASVPVYGDA
ncbi:MAG: SDR family oxidoreductase [Haloferacaceae archaeon]|jgi:Dehydrogenases with different specificities (related to short-chain alcohol dehydrogenases)|nr:SDR family oxidoreductase [Haloferacaceae archaeon]